MVTSNSGESRSRSTRNNGDGKERGRSYQNGEKKEYKPYNKGPRDNNNGPRDNDKRYVKNTGDYKGSRDNNRDNRDNRNSNGSDRGPRNSFRNNDSRPFNKFGGNKPYKKNYGDRNYGNPYDKDSDDDSKPQRRQAPSKDNKVKEQQPDKIEIINRIEKEKKAIQKKQAERKNNKPVKQQQSKPKRTNNIDWTKEYENGSYDDDDLDIYL